MRRILLAVSGLSPQVITETLYCLHAGGRMVDEIHIVTTRQGKDLLLAALLDGGGGKFYRFCQDYGIDQAKVDFGPANIHTPRDARGRELDDIFSASDNEALLSLCLRLTAALTASPDSAVYFLVAGGRKTMTSCLSFAAQAYGRPQDRMYHVLVSPEFENHRDFWYPEPDSRLLELRDKNGAPFYKESRYAALQLIAIPFLSLRRHLPGHLLAGPDSPGALLASLVREEERFFTLSLSAKSLAYGDVEADMHPARLALLAFFVETRLAGGEPESGGGNACPPWFLGVEEIFARQERITALYETIRGARACGMSDTGIVSLNAENFRSYRSHIRRDLRRAFGAPGAALDIQSWGKRPDTRYGLRLDARLIRLRP